MPIETDAWGLDLVVAGTQKAHVDPPGLSFASVSRGRLGAQPRHDTPRFYFDWRRTPMRRGAAAARSRRRWRP